MLKVTYVGPIEDASGYAEASRLYIAALHSVGVRPDVLPASFETFRSDTGELGRLAKSLMHSNPSNKIRIIHLTPQNYQRFRDPNCFNIGFSTWETDRLPDAWVPMINQMDEVWVPCEHNLKVYQNSGVTRPIKIFPHPIKVPDRVDPMVLNNTLDRDFVFYNIFQWTARKNPEGLLTAYLTEFESNEPVCLLLKTYLVNPTREDEGTSVKNLIGEVKSKLHLKAYPRLLLLTRLLSKDEILALHSRGDCLVSPHRCEGVGLPLMEAMAMGKPIVTTSYGGPSDFYRNVDDSSTYYPVTYLETPCSGMPWDLYHAKMNWAEPSIAHLKKQMRKVYEDKQSRDKVAKLGQEEMQKNYSLERIGLAMKARIEGILESFS